MAENTFDIGDWKSVAVMLTVGTRQRSGHPQRFSVIPGIRTTVGATLTLRAILGLLEQNGVKALVEQYEYDLPDDLVEVTTLVDPSVNGTAFLWRRGAKAENDLDTQVWDQSEIEYFLVSEPSHASIEVFQLDVKLCWPRMYSPLLSDAWSSEFTRHVDPRESGSST